VGNLSSMRSCLRAPFMVTDVACQSACSVMQVTSLSCSICNITRDGSVQVEVSIVPISGTSAASKERTSRVGIADKSVSDACFNDWKRFCFVLREIASGENGRPLSGLEAQTRAQAVLTECGYPWPGRARVHEPVVAPTAAPESLNAQASIDSEQSSAGTKPKSVGNAQSRPRRRRSDPPPSEHRIGAITAAARA
jgi:hypothetical protein